jgi:hypothetical protein
MFDHEDLPDFSWSHMEQLYRQGQAQWQQTKRSLLQQVHGSQTFRSAWRVLARLAHALQASAFGGCNSFGAIRADCKFHMLAHIGCTPGRTCTATIARLPAQ